MLVAVVAGTLAFLRLGRGEDPAFTVRTMVVGAEEGSNVDIASQFTQMIVAQRAYTANSKVITTANSMMQDALNMIQG